MSRSSLSALRFGVTAKYAFDEVEGYKPDSPPAAACVAPFAVVSTTAGFRAAYDPNGNMVLRVENGVAYTQTFDAENRLAVVTNTLTGEATRFVYDGDGNRVLRIDGSGATVFIGDYYEKQGSLIRKYYYAGGQRIAVRVGDVVYWLHSDHLGSATLTTDINGNGVGELRYTPYGLTQYEWGNTPTNRRYTGQRWEGALGLYDYRARFYDPALGRFMQADTIVPEAGNPQSLNRYAYVYNNPLRYTDPQGHIPLDWLLDLAGLAIDVYSLYREPSWENVGWLALDVVLWAVPYVPAVGGVVGKGGRLAISHADEAADLFQAASHTDEVMDAARLVEETVSHANEAADALRAADRLDEVTDVLRAGEETAERLEQTAKGGTYMLVDRATGELKYVGQTRDLARRAAEHGRDPVKGQLRFDVDWRVDDYAVRRGREQMLYEQYRPPLNRNRPISPRNPRLQEYLEATRRFGERMR